MAIAMLVMFACILLLLLVIGFLLIRHAGSNPLKKTEVLTADYIDANGDIAGKWGYVKISKSDLLSVNGKQFSNFVKTVVEKDDYPLFTILCNDGTGIVFKKGASAAYYGYVNANGQLTESFGEIKEKDGMYSYYSK